MDLKCPPSSHLNACGVVPAGRKYVCFSARILLYNSWRVTAVASTGQVEIAFAGRSNAGKSSAINSLTNRSRLAFVSKTPGRTQNLNFFQLDTGFLVDLPGYGYAKVPPEVRQHWEGLLSTYLQTRESLHGMVLIMDVRHPLTPLDRQMLDWFSPTGKPVHILLTKSDKLSRQQAQKTPKQCAGIVAGGLRAMQRTIIFQFNEGRGGRSALPVLGIWLGKRTSPVQAQC